MFISLDVLEKRPVDFQEEFPPGTIDLGPDYTQEGPLTASGSATLIEEHEGRNVVIQDIRLIGSFSGSIGAACGRCLEPVRRQVESSFDLLYRPQGVDAGREEISVTQAEAEIGYYRGDGLLLEDMLREQILLSVPIRALCREDCKGLCPVCGRNLNTESCDCAKAPVDWRWEALKKLRETSF